MADDQILPPSQEETPKEELDKSDPSDKLTPDHPRFKDVLEDNRQKAERIEALERQMSDLKETIEQRQRATGDDEYTPEERASLDRIERGLKQRAFVTKEDLESDLRVQRRALEIDKLSDRYSGGNGYPKFISEDVVTYAKAKGYGDNLEAAYKDMHFEAILQTESKKQREINPPQSEKPTGTERALEGDIREEVSKMSPAEYEKNREKILAGMKNSGK